MLRFKHIILLISPTLFIFLGLFFISNLIKNNFNYEPNDNYKSGNNFSYKIYYTKSKILSKLSRKFNIENEKDKIPELIKYAFISAEDRRFLKHNGVDIFGSARAFINNIRSGYIREGGSTITQQASRLIFLNNDLNVKRKIKEIIISIIMDYKYSKNQILKIYLNEIYLGEGAKGINEASQIYFGKLIDELTLSEIAMLAGLAPAPNFYSPYQNYHLAIQRRDEILKLMYLGGHIDKANYERALKEKIKLINKKNNEDKLLINFILTESVKKINAEVNYQIDDFLIINTSIEKEWQDKAQKLSQELLPEGIEASLISIESDTGLIKTMISGRYPEYNQFNRATSAIRPLSSTFKIIPYSLAFLEGKSLLDTYNDAPTCWEDYCPKNFSNIYQGESTLIESFKKSSNIVPIKISYQFGLEKIINLANLFGINYKKELSSFLPTAIGGFGDSLLNITNAYSTINNKGKLIKPSVIKKIIRSKNKEIIWENNYQTKKIIDKEIVNKLNYLLEKTVQDGTGISASIAGRKIFGKTGTSDLNKDLWFIGSINNITTGVWIGFDDNRATNLSSGTSANFWKTYIKSINI